MARITVEDCLQRENNRFSLVQLAAKRSKQILSGSRLVIEGVTKGNKAIVNSLREIAEGKVRFMTSDEATEFKERQAAKAAEARLESEKQRQVGIADIFKETPVFSDSSSSTGSNGSSSASAGDEE